MDWKTSKTSPSKDSTSRRTPRASQASSTSNTQRSTLTSRDTSIEPKSEYLREALNSRKAKNPSPVNPSSQPATPIEHPGDEWAANAEEEDASGNDTSKRRFRRASEVKEQRPTPTRKFTQK